MPRKPDPVIPLHDKWPKLDTQWYSRKRRQHRPFWDLIYDFIETNMISSILEIGGGDGYLSRHVGKYTNIELNPSAIKDGREMYPRAEFIHGNWLSMDTEQFTGKYEMILAAAVLDHCPHYSEFIKRIKRAKPQCFFVTFYKPLIVRSKDLIRQTGSVERKKFVHYNNWYCIAGVRRFLKRNKMSKDTVVFDIKRPSQEMDKRESVLYWSWDPHMKLEMPETANVRWPC